MFATGDKWVHRPAVNKLSNVVLTAMDEHYIVQRNYRAIISILSEEVFTRGGRFCE